VLFPTVVPVIPNKANRVQAPFAALLDFKRQKGHCRVPILYKEGDFKLGWWVVMQRRNRREMSAERRARLNKIGFVWRAPLPYRPTGGEHRAISAPIARIFDLHPIRGTPRAVGRAKPLGQDAPITSAGRVSPLGPRGIV